VSDDRFEDFLRRAVQDYHRPPETPREEMWARIAAARADRPRARQLGTQSLRLRWAFAAAAAVAAGVALASGFWPRVRLGGWTEPRAAAAEAGGWEAFEVAAFSHFREVETFLTAFRREAASRSSAAPTGSQAADLLATTRLLMDSPAGRDPRLEALLEDIEVVLAQIASYERDRNPYELGLIEHGIEERALLLKLGAVRPDKYAMAIVEGVL
jgi:hypothetical protein